MSEVSHDSQDTSRESVLHTSEDTFFFMETYLKVNYKYILKIHYGLKVKIKMYVIMNKIMGWHSPARCYSFTWDIPMYFDVFRHALCVYIYKYSIYFINLK